MPWMCLRTADMWIRNLSKDEHSACGADTAKDIAQVLQRYTNADIPNSELKGAVMWVARTVGCPLDSGKNGRMCAADIGEGDGGWGRVEWCGSSVQETSN